jgi:hypothetical protein
MRTRTIDNFEAPPAPVPPSKKTKEKIIKSNIKNDSKIDFELKKMPETDEKPKRKQPEHLKKALEARREKKAQKVVESATNSDSDSDLDMNKLMMKKQPKKYLSDSD